MFKSQNVKFSPKKWNELTPVTLKTTIQESRDEFDTILVQGLSFSVNSDDIVRESPKIYDERVKDFYSLPYEESDSAIVLRNRSYLAVGRTAEKEIIGSSYRSLLVFNPQRQISDIVGDRPYTVQNATLTLSTKDSSLASGTMYLGVALGATVDASATWDSPNPATNDEWTVGSGGGPVVQRVTPDTLVPILEDIVPFIPWSDLFPIRSEDQSPTDPPQNSTELIERINTYLNATTTAVTLNNSAKAVFDVTTLVNEWSKNSKTPMRFVIWSPQLELERRLVKFESSETSVGKIGDGLFLTCAFLNSENTTSIRTQGIRCIISPQNGNVLIKTVDNDADSSKNFAAFQTLVSIGATFEFRDPDINNEITLGTSICTVVDRPDDNSMVASGIPFPIAISKHETSVEFSASVPIPNGTYILDVKSPSEVSKNSLMMLNPNDEIAVNYSSAEENNNSKTFSVKMVSDERQFNDRIRLFLNEYVISEDRTGQPTQILRAGVVPTLKIDLLLS